MSAGCAICVLASGSGGNCSAILLPGPPERTLLVDLGLSPRTTRSRLRDIGRAWSSVTDVLLTHLDSDHFGERWVVPLLHAPIRVHARTEHCARLARAGVPSSRLVPAADDGPGADGWTAVDDGTRLRGVPVPHDEGWSTAWLVEHGGLRIGYATDLGHAPPCLFDAFQSLDALLLESNYDPDLQRASPRPEFLKRRIMGGRGHLSNEEALEAILSIAGRSRLQQIALLHLSRQCNDPAIVHRLWLRRAPHLLDLLTLSAQHVTTPVLRLLPAFDRTAS